MSTPQVEAFLEMMAVERDASPHTLSAYGRDLADAEAGVAGGLMLGDEAAVEAWYADLGRRGLSPATQARRRSAVRQFYRFALGEGWRPDDPSRRLNAPKQGRSLPRTLTGDEIARLLAASAAHDGAAGLRLVALVELAYASGLRVSELLGLRVEAVRRDPAFLIVRGKGGKERLAPLNDAARTAVKAWLILRDADKARADSSWLFPSGGQSLADRPRRRPARKGPGQSVAVPLGLGQGPPDPAPLRPVAGPGRRRRRDRPGPRQPPRPAPRLRHPPA